MGKKSGCENLFVNVEGGEGEFSPAGKREARPEKAISAAKGGGQLAWKKRNARGKKKRPHTEKERQSSPNENCWLAAR